MGHQPENRMHLLSSARTDKGRVRQNNEDSIDLWEAGQFVLAVVADGMGGAVAGEEASKIAIETVRERLTDDYHQAPDDYADDDEDYLMERLVDVIKTANLNIRERAMQFPELKGMGTTMTLAFTRNSDISIVHVGDSRAYQVDGHDGSIHQLTADHSFVQALVDAGHITEEEAENHPMRNVLYRALGQDQNVDVDMYTDLRLGIGDRLVLCSDGLTLHVKPQEIADAVMANPKPDDATEKLLALANSRGGKDNISVIVVMLESTATNEKTTELHMTALEDDATDPIKPTFYDNVDTVKIDQLSDDDTPPIYNSKYGEGSDTNEPSQ
jgi:PPM family protein phosphatase